VLGPIVDPRVHQNASLAPATGARRLRVVYCTRGGLFGALVLERLRASERIEICGIVRSARMMQPTFGFARGALAYLRRSGVQYSLYLWCTTSLADVLCRLAGVTPVPMRTRGRGIPVCTTRNINDAAGIGFLRACAPDLLVSAFFDQRLEAAALGTPRLGCVNIHPSLLPAFKGVDPVLQARLRGVSSIGVTVHHMAPELDSGAILAQRAIPTPERSSVFDSTALLFRQGAELLVSELDRIEGGTGAVAQRTPGDYQSWPSRAEIRALRGRGVALIRPSDFWGVKIPASAARAHRMS